MSYKDEKESYYFSSNEVHNLQDHCSSPTDAAIYQPHEFLKSEPNDGSLTSHTRLYARNSQNASIKYQSNTSVPSAMQEMADESDLTDWTY